MRVASRTMQAERYIHTVLGLISAHLLGRREIKARLLVLVLCDMQIFKLW